MRRQSILIIVFILIMSACSQIATPLPLPTGTATTRPSSTVSNEERTAAAQFVPTEVASFTPTYTPSITATPSNTPTPTSTFTPTAIPEDILCEEFVVSGVIDSRIPADDREDFVQVFLPYADVTINVETYNTDTGELLIEGSIPGDDVYIFDYSPVEFPDEGNYEWIYTLSDATRSGLCERRGTFDTLEDEVIPPLFPTPEPTGEATTELTAEVTAELSAEVTPEFTAESTEQAAELTEEATIEISPSPTAIPFRFPPR